jgi:hypothetical protein
MKPMYCAICGDLAAVLEKGSKIKTGAVIICSTCWGDEKPYREEPYHPGEMPDFLKDLFRVRG